MSRISQWTTRQIVAICIVGVACLVVAVQYARMIEPAAAREIQQACKGLRPAAENPRLELPSQTPIDFTAVNHEGKQVSLSDYRGKVVFVNFWASWCDVCASEKPGLEKMTRALRSQHDDFEVITLASDASWDKVRERLPGGATFDVLLDPPQGDETLGPIAKSFGLDKVPESFVVDREGRVQYYFVNKRDWHSDVAETCLRGVIEG